MTDPIVAEIYESVERLTPDQRRQLFTLLGSRVGIPRTKSDVHLELSALQAAQTPSAPNHLSLAGRYAKTGRDSAQDDTIAIIRELRTDWENERDDLLAPYSPSNNPR
jgi:hypothetical protein